MRLLQQRFTCISFESLEAFEIFFIKLLVAF